MREACATIRHMHLLKRIELWVLLAVVLAGLAWVFMSGGSREDTVNDGGAASARDAQAPLQLHRCVLKRDYGNARLDIDLRVRNDGTEKLLMRSPKVKLLAPKGREIPSYFLPFDPVPEIPPHSAQDVQLRYWLETADLQGALSLEVDGKTLAIKSEGAFDLNSVKNNEEKVISPGAW
jgi:hypothetical protein